MKRMLLSLLWKRAVPMNPCSLLQTISFFFLFSAPLSPTSAPPYPVKPTLSSVSRDPDLAPVRQVLGVACPSERTSGPDRVDVVGEEEEKRPAAVKSEPMEVDQEQPSSASSRPQPPLQHPSSSSSSETPGKKGFHNFII